MIRGVGDCMTLTSFPWQMQDSACTKPLSRLNSRMDGSFSDDSEEGSSSSRPRNSSVPSCRPTQSAWGCGAKPVQLFPGSGEGQSTVGSSALKADRRSCGVEREEVSNPALRAPGRVA